MASHGGRAIILPLSSKYRPRTKWHTRLMNRRVERHNKHLSNTVKLIITQEITTANFNQNVR